MESPNTKNATFVKLINFFGYKKESGGDSFKGIYHNPEKNTKLVLSDNVGAILSTETGDSLGKTELNPDNEPSMFKDIAYLLYQGD